MALIKKPVNGMKDILPDEMALRTYVINLIRQTYASYGFSSLETPAVEHIENLLSKQGGDNEKLIFKILKRGEKLHLAEATEEAEVTDSGLRYDLTLPLSRYYANHVSELPAPFKALQIGPVWRADRPQRGRFRQFTQCDIDILGEADPCAEIELILAISTVLTKLDFHGFTVRINDRRLLKDTAAAAGFKEDDYDSVFIPLDKMDKIGRDGVREELADKFDAAIADRYMELFDKVEPAYDLRPIIDTVDTLKSGDYKIVFDPTLVRGMSYYTGPIFEIAMDEFGGSVGGGGRYDGMIGRFSGVQVPACGFSIGFERIVMLLMERGFKVPGTAEKTAFLIEKGYSPERLTEIFKEAEALRAAGQTVSVTMMKKNRKFQKEQLANEGYTTIKEYFNG